jgi:hypothetical protein
MIQGFDDQKLKKKNKLNFFYIFFDQKLHFFKRRFFIGLLSSVQYLSTISTIIFYVSTGKLWFECV